MLNWRTRGALRSVKLNNSSLSLSNGVFDVVDCPSTMIPFINSSFLNKTDITAMQYLFALSADIAIKFFPS